MTTQQPPRDAPTAGVFHGGNDRSGSRQAQRGPVLESVPQHAVVTGSGGMRSTVLAHWLRRYVGTPVSLLSVDDGRAPRAPLRRVRATARRLDVRHYEVDVRNLGRLLCDELGTRGPDVPSVVNRGGSTTTPNRFLLVLDIAVGLAVSTGADAVAVGGFPADMANLERRGFLDTYARLARIGNPNALWFRVIAPFIDLTGPEIVRYGVELDVDFSLSWSCHFDVARHCGTCAGCGERRQAFDGAGVADPTVYRPDGQQHNHGGCFD